jgi:hypothetical protein
MKKIILLIVAFIFIANYSNAQDNSSAQVNISTQDNRTDFRDKLQLGLKIGTNYSNVYDTKGEEFRANGKFGFVIGAFVAVPIGKYLGIQPEILLSQKGFKATGGNITDSSNYDLTRTTSYIDIPLLVSLKPSGYLTLLFGPQYSFLIKQKDEFATATTRRVVEQEFEDADIRKNTLCLLGGIDVNLDHIVVGARIGWDMLNNNGDGTSTTPRYKNVWYQLTLGYRFYY